MDTSSVNSRLVRSQIAQIRRSLRRLSQLAALPEAEFLGSSDNFAIAEHHLRRAIETALDVGRHLVARLALGPANEYADVPRLLGEHQILPPEVANAGIRLARLRNRLVHFYWQVEPPEMHALLGTRLTDIESFCTEVLAFLRAHEARPQGSA